MDAANPSGADAVGAGGADAAAAGPGPDLPAGAALDVPLPKGRTFFNPRPSSAEQGIPFVVDKILVQAGAANRRRALVRILQARWPTLPGYVDFLAEDATNHAGKLLSEVHGDAKSGKQGP